MSIVENEAWPFASVEDVTDRLGRDLTGDEQTKVYAALDDAAAVLFGYLGTCWTEESDVPFPVYDVIAKMVARSFKRSAGADEFVTGQGAGPFTAQYGTATSTGDVWLSASDKLALRPYRCGGGLTSVQLVGERYTISSSSES